MGCSRHQNRDDVSARERSGNTGFDAGLFVATKLEAFAGRGNDDLLFSRDAEDILLVVDGREALLEEISGTREDVRTYITERFTALIALPDFDDFLEGNIRGPTGRVDIVRERFIAISRCGNGGPDTH
ncbi:hypothetical protein QO002_005324 [Pararhizobium capsulatum DSM 1112]|uniref:Uncharacterized protein n=1 Tax=Pararhizobium capsulatum DSM 1112 TaxID=1121113 RepID=A0ABU0BXW4_9HYPH|nr:hypothetical protein [Pararhizobium capsulatum]MDQ0323118.1 hypothetical protein [Pararhizobium capsulatum DSM 1112]